MIGKIADAFRSSMLHRMAAIGVATAGLIAMAVGLVGFLMVREVERQHMESELLQDLERVSSAMDAAFGTVLQDLTILARTPPIQGIARTIGTGAPDPRDGSSRVEDWTARLADIFASFYPIRPEYMQIRYIGLTGNGREIVRVDRTPDGIVRTPQDALQTKQDEAYFAMGASLQPGEIYIGNASWNRENGVVIEPRIAMIRFIVPVFGSDGARFGMIVINVNAEPFIDGAMRDSGTSRRVVLLGSSGNTYVYHPDTDDGVVEIAAETTAVDEAIDTVAEAGETRDVVIANGLAMARGLYNGVTPGGGAIRAAVLEDASVFASGRRTASTVLAASILVLTIVSILVSKRLTARSLAPLAALNSALLEASRTYTKPSLPIDRPDEIGHISRSFDDLLKQLEQRENRAKTVFDNVSDGVVITDPKGIIQTVNPALCRMFGYGADDMIGQPLSCLMPPTRPDQHGDQISYCPTSGIPMTVFNTIERTGRHRDGHAVPIDVKLNEIFNEEEHYFAGIIRDVSRRHALDKERIRLIAALKQSNEELDSFAYVASHDLKAPLRTILNATNWIVEDFEGEMTDEMQINIDLLRSRAHRMERLLEDLLEHSRIGRKTRSQPNTPVDGARLRGTIETLLHVPDGFTLTFDPGFDDIVVTETPLSQVLVNVIGNALKHHDRDTGTVRVSVNRENDRYRFTVTDDGPGIEPQYHDRIFQLFSTLKARDKVEGSGMGLAIVSKHIAFQGGTISVASEGNGSGAAFTFTWPVAESAPGAAAPTALSA